MGGPAESPGLRKPGKHMVKVCQQKLGKTLEENGNRSPAGTVALTPDFVDDDMHQAWGNGSKVCPSKLESLETIGLSEEPEDGCSGHAVRHEAEVRWWQWTGMTSFQLVYSSVNTGMALFVLPTEAERLNDDSAGMWVGVYLSVCGVTQLVCPIAGKISDRHVSRWGRRRPFIVGGTAVVMLCFAALWFASVNMMPRLYLFILFPAQIALNVVYSAQCGLPADVQMSCGAEGSKGFVSGIVAFHSFFGALLSMLFIVATRKYPVQVEYPMYIVSLFICCQAVCFSVKETPTYPSSGRRVTLADLKESFWVDLREDMDFFWVCVGRFFYYITTSCVVFMYYYMRDMLHLATEEERKFHLGVLVISAQLVAACLAVPFGKLSNVIGRKRVIYLACSLMSACFLTYCWAPKVGEHGSWAIVLAAGLVYGVGSSAYLSVDYALALDCMPTGKSNAEAFGLWGIAGFFGSTAGPMVGGLFLEWSRDTTQLEKDQYSYLGYSLVMCVLGVLMDCMVMLVTKRIQKVR